MVVQIFTKLAVQPRGVWLPKPILKTQQYHAKYSVWDYIEFSATAAAAAAVLVNRITASILLYINLFSARSVNIPC